jgi:tripartite-type tricarboxylate transporter receptor subunit TctC
VVEEGMPFLVAENFIGVSAPAGMPEAAMRRLHAAVQDSLDDANFVKRLGELGLTVRRMSQPEFAAFVQNQIRGWEPAVKASGAKLN